jgi:hypothetical protein
MTTEDALPSFPQPTAMDPAAAGLPAKLSAAAAVRATTKNPILASLFKEMLRSMMNISSSLAPPVIPGMPMDGEKWRRQRILELQVRVPAPDSPAAGPGAGSAGGAHCSDPDNHIMELEA